MLPVLKNIISEKPMLAGYSLNLIIFSVKLTVISVKRLLVLPTAYVYH